MHLVDFTDLQEKTLMLLGVYLKPILSDVEVKIKNERVQEFPLPYLLCGYVTAA